MAYEFDKMSINGTVIDAKDKYARDIISSMNETLSATTTTAQNALNKASANEVNITDIQANIGTMQTTIQENYETTNNEISALQEHDEESAEQISELTTNVNQISGKTTVSDISALITFPQIVTAHSVYAFTIGNLIIVSGYVATEETGVNLPLMTLPYFLQRQVRFPVVCINNYVASSNNYYAGSAKSSPDNSKEIQFHIPNAGQYCFNFTAIMEE